MNDYARNPKTDVHFPYNSSRRRFNFPPPIPGLPSPSFPPTAEHAGHPQLQRHGSSGGPLPSSLASPPPQRGVFGTPGFNPLSQNHVTSQGRSGQSPLQSLLLDPHHQPSASGFGNTSPQALRPRGVGSLLAKLPRRTVTMDRTQQLHHDDVVEEEDGPPEDLQTGTRPIIQQNGTDPRPPLATKTSRSGELGSWNYEVDSSSGANSEEENERDVKAIMAPMGPLGLIRQFQKVQAQERGGGLGGIGGEV